MAVLCLIYGVWHFGTNWTTTLLSFLQWDTVEVLTIVDLAYIQAFGSLCNAITDSTGPKTMFLFSAVFTALYYVGLGFGRCWYSFFFLQILRIGYQLDSTIEMYLATITTERERTGALMFLTIPQAMSMFIAPVVASKIAVYTTLRISQILNGIVLATVLVPVLLFFLPTTHSIPRLASARLRPQDYWPMLKRNAALREGIILRGLLIVAYVCYELIARNFLLRAYMRGASDSAEVLIVMGCSLLFTQFAVLPFLQKYYSPKTLLQLSILSLIVSYGAVNFTTSLMQFLVIVAVQTGAYAIAYAESSTQITASVETTDLGKATGLASMVQWTSHFLVPIYTSHLVNHWHYTYAFYTSAAIMVGTLVYITLFAKQTNARLRTLLPNLITT
ncbi:major facilitator superfamily domain-containing protein [Ditylenchus destructor]|uniref:Major facilitator superfamily domain-containing protein n=1 Tax=Ditylenchus destructor TaxID=166010 RepID=A0AAD4N7J5_9BILA|nr:major facilitator superfamily domain-containing protein [Ditylenchus destructor]